jgi:glycosyltransferase involved in cell wall biosynthesis
VTKSTAPKPLHVVLLNQAFHPDVVATAQMGTDLARALAARGHRVTAVASRSMYGQAGAALPPREHLDAPPGRIDIRRVGSSLFGKSSTAKRVLDFGLFYARAVWALLVLPRPDVVVAFTTPPYIALGGLLCRWLRGSRNVQWVMDLYPDVAVAGGLVRERSLTHRLLEWVSRWLMRRSDANVVLGRCMRARVLAKGVPETRVRLIPVWSDLAGLTPIAPGANPLRSTYAPAGEFVVMYSGNFGLAHDSATLLDAMQRLRDERGLRFVFVGGGKRRGEIEAFMRTNALPNAAWHEYQPRERLGESLAAGDAHLVSVGRGWEGLIVPSKLYGILAVGRPVLFVGPRESEVARVLDETGAGLCVEPGDGEGLARAIRALRDHPARRAALGEAALRAASAYTAGEACRQWAELLEAPAPARARAEVRPA